MNVRNTLSVVGLLQPEHINCFLEVCFIYELIVSMNKEKQFMIYRGRVEVDDGIFGWIFFFFHSLSVVDKEYETLKPATKIWE